jgi:HEAT repeat protein
MKSAETLIEELKHSDFEAVALAREQLAGMSYDIVETLCLWLPTASTKQSWEILNVLTKLRDRRSVPAVSELLMSENGALQVAAAQCLGVIGDRSATMPLLHALSSLGSSGALVWIIQALGFLGDDRATDALLKVMRETDSSAIRYTAIEALGRIGNTRATLPIQTYLNDESQHVRARAEVALGQLIACR